MRCGYGVVCVPAGRQGGYSTVYTVSSCGRVPKEWRSSARVLHTEVAAQRCPFAVLGVPRGASVADIKSKYRQEAMKHHPDRSSSDGQRFMKLAVAYSTLTGAGQHSRDSKEMMNARDAERILDSIRDCREVVELLIRLQ